jgi:hypothetical protein
VKDKAARSLPADYKDLRDKRTYRADCTIIAEPTRPIEGKKVAVPNEGHVAKKPMPAVELANVPITGRIVDGESNLVSGTTIRPNLKLGGDFFLNLPTLRLTRTGDLPCTVCQPDVINRWLPKADRP